MSLTVKDEKKLAEWFEAKDKCFTSYTNIRHALEDYYKYRDLIFDTLYDKLSNLLDLKKYEWKKIHGIDPDDAVSIFHDALLSAINNYNVKTKTKFITYFWWSLKSRLQNYVRKYMTKKVYKATGMTQRKIIPTPSLVSLDFIVNYTEDGERETGPYRKLLLEYLSENSSYFDSTINCKIFYDHVMRTLPTDKKYILSASLSGETCRAIADSLGVSNTTVMNKIKQLRSKFNKFENDL